MRLLNGIPCGRGSRLVAGYVGPPWAERMLARLRKAAHRSSDTKPSIARNPFRSWWSTCSWLSTLPNLDVLGKVGAMEPRELTVLGASVHHAIEHVEVFPAPEHVNEVRFSTDELMSLCPVTGQPDISSIEISYVPRKWCVESKSLKLYLWGFRDRPVFAEALAAEIAGEFMGSAEPAKVSVRLRQRPRGGITIEAVAERAAEV